MFGVWGKHSLGLKMCVSLARHFQSKLSNIRSLRTDILSLPFVFETNHLVNCLVLRIQIICLLNSKITRISTALALRYSFRFGHALCNIGCISSSFSGYYYFMYSRWLFKLAYVVFLYSSQLSHLLLSMSRGLLEQIMNQIHLDPFG